MDNDYCDREVSVIRRRSPTRRGTLRGSRPNGSGRPCLAAGRTGANGEGAGNLYGNLSSLTRSIACSAPQNSPTSWWAACMASSRALWWTSKFRMAFRHAPTLPISDHRSCMIVGAAVSIGEWRSSSRFCPMPLTTRKRSRPSSGSTKKALDNDVRRNTMQPRAEGPGAACRRERYAHIAIAAGCWRRRRKNQDLQPRNREDLNNEQRRQRTRHGPVDFGPCPRANRKALAGMKSDADRPVQIFGPTIAAAGGEDKGESLDRLDHHAHPEGGHQHGGSGTLDW